jgi:hypothetical protein
LDKTSILDLMGGLGIKEIWIPGHQNSIMHYIYAGQISYSERMPKCVGTSVKSRGGIQLIAKISKECYMKKSEYETMS